MKNAQVSCEKIKGVCYVVVNDVHIPVSSITYRKVATTILKSGAELSEKPGKKMAEVR